MDLSTDPETEKISRGTLGPDAVEDRGGEADEPRLGARLRRVFRRNGAPVAADRSCTKRLDAGERIERDSAGVNPGAFSVVRLQPARGGADELVGHGQYTTRAGTMTRGEREEDGGLHFDAEDSAGLPALVTALFEVVEDIGADDGAAGHLPSAGSGGGGERLRQRRIRWRGDAARHRQPSAVVGDRGVGHDQRTRCEVLLQSAGRPGAHQQSRAQLDQLVNHDAGAAAAHAGGLDGHGHAAIGPGEPKQAACTRHLTRAVHQFVGHEPGSIGIAGAERPFGLIGGGRLQMECHAGRQTTGMGDVLMLRVADDIARHRMVSVDSRVLALVSGGADSMCLLHLLMAVVPGRVGVLTVDHGVRRDSAGEADAVAAAAAELGLPVWIERLGMADGAGLQERARDGRLAAARRVARQHGFDRIATGHTASDQAETVLFRLARGTGRSGALGMAPINGDLIRPLLCVTAEETRTWCAERGIVVVEDPSNADVRFARARVRHQLLPALEGVQRGAARAVARFADQLRDEGEVLDGVVDAAWERCADRDGLRAASLVTEPPAVARLLIWRLLRDAGLAVDATRVARCVDLAYGGGRPIEVTGGRVAVDRGVLVAEGRTAGAPGEVTLTIPGTVRFGDHMVRATRAAAGVPTATRVALDVVGPLVVRSPRAGDRLALSGGGRQAVGKLLAAAGVPARHRPFVPVVASGERVVWVGGYRADPTLLAAHAAPATVLEVTVA